MNPVIFLDKAIEFAQKGLGLTSPNPAVGAVIVKGGKIIGEGWHKKAGTDHAEIVAIKDAKRRGKSVKGSTLYVTLEPCAHYGRTPPCVDAILKAGIKKVVVGMIDPNPLVNNKSVQLLRRKKIAVEVLNKKSVQGRAVRALNQPFIKHMTTGLPYVVLKAATSLDGRIATRIGDSKWITGKEAREDARRERSMCDAVLVGVGTVLADDPELGAHGVFHAKKLLRIIIDPELRSPLSSKVFRDKYVFVATTDRASRERKQVFDRKGIDCQSFGKNKVSIPALLKFLGKRDIQSLFVEGGAGVHGSFVDTALKDKQYVDRFVWYIAPKIIGGADATSAVGGEGISRIADALRLRDVVVEQVGKDVRTCGVINQY